MTSLFSLVNVDQPDWTTIQQLLRFNKELIKRPIGASGRFILHYACWKRAPTAFVIELVNDYPQAVQEMALGGAYPLHYACQHDQSETVIRMLIETYPQATKQRVAGGYPLHHACAFQQPEMVIKLLITTFKEAIKRKGR